MNVVLKQIVCEFVGDETTTTRSYKYSALEPINNVEEKLGYKKQIMFYKICWKKLLGYIKEEHLELKKEYLVKCYLKL